ncbi:MAG: polysaccharide biosynthesis/export family protein [bacterium]
MIYFEVVMAFLTACSISPQLLSESTEPNKLIRAGDLIELKFENYPDFNQSIIVDTDGTASLKVLGEINISGLSSKALKALLNEKYSYWLVDPKIELIVRESTNFTVYIGGEVSHPGIVKFKGAMTVGQGILLAGGLKDKTMDYKVFIFRNQGIEGVKVYKFDIKKNVTGRHSNRNFKLAPYDVVYVMRTSDIKPNKGQLI